jgi:N utilization substance protein B
MLIENELGVIDEKIKRCVKAYEFDRVQSVEKTVLRLSAYELLFKKAPMAQVVREAVRLTKKFGTEAATSFVHAVLDALSKDPI